MTKVVLLVDDSCFSDALHNGLIVYSFRLDHNRCRLVGGYQAHDVISGARAPCETVSFKMKLGTRPHARSFRGVTEELTVSNTYTPQQSEATMSHIFSEIGSQPQQFVVQVDGL